MTYIQLAAQGLSLLATFVIAIFRAIVYIPYALLHISVRAVCPSSWFSPPRGASFYRGVVLHSRRRPRKNAFTYPVRMAVIDLDEPPRWFDVSSADLLTAAAARRLAGTSGPVSVLTHPPAAGYVQNPISVYYCYEAPADGSQGFVDLKMCIAEVTNTPWGERVRFAFRPTTDDGQGGEQVPKALHVSPLMDMKNTWTLKASAPTEKLFLSVAASHPELGEYFIAALSADLDIVAPHWPNELASLESLWKYGFQPQRVAWWIYWQAVKLLWKGVQFYAPPDEAYKAKVEKEVADRPKLAGGAVFQWRPAREWPWRASGA